MLSKTNTMREVSLSQQGYDFSQAGSEKWGMVLEGNGKRVNKKGT